MEAPDLTFVLHPIIPRAVCQAGPGRSSGRLPGGEAGTGRRRTAVAPGTSGPAPRHDDRKAVFQGHSGMAPGTGTISGRSRTRRWTGDASAGPEADRQRQFKDPVR
ncbi:hypothetical protein SCMC78_33460 [Streptomyces sp. CMC78]|uniref:Uncharacterized protein n=1 Tax=Streptomyces sp. CMC78 TaxID=3231512 RepID=A0AB33KD89_9ACTN